MKKNLDAIEAYCRGDVELELKMRELAERLAADDHRSKWRSLFFRVLGMFAGIVLAGFLLMILMHDAWGACEWSWCTDDAPKRTYITDTARVKVGDLYHPTPTRRVQIRDNDRKIIGYIETNGNITDTNRRIVGHVED